MPVKDVVFPLPALDVNVSVSRQGEGHVGVSRFRVHLPSPGGDHHVLLPIDLVPGGGRVPACGELRLPEHFARLRVQSPKHFVSRGADEDEPSSRNHGPSVVLEARLRYAPRRQLRIFAQRHLPHDLARIHVDGIQRPPWRFHGRVALRVHEPMIARARVLHGYRLDAAPVGLSADGGEEWIPVQYAHTGHQRFVDSKGYPAVPAQWGTLNATDMNAGKLEW